MNKLGVIGGVALVAVAAGVWWTSQSSQTSQSFPIASANAQEASDVDTSSIIEMTLGAEDAPVKIIEYASFTCPHCASFHNGPLKKLKAEYVDTGKVHFTYRDVYFDAPGLWAAMVARCGGEERFFGITDMLYEQQHDWMADRGDPVKTANNLRRIGKIAGLGEEQIETCLNDQAKGKALVAWYQKNATADGVNATPTLIIDGETMGNMSYDRLKEVIDGKL